MRKPYTFVNRKPRAPKVKKERPKTYKHTAEFLNRIESRPEKPVEEIHWSDKKRKYTFRKRLPKNSPKAKRLKSQKICVMSHSLPQVHELQAAIENGTDIFKLYKNYKTDLTTIKRRPKQYTKGERLRFS